MKLLKPDLSVQALTDIDIAYWYRKGIRCILIDLDNTISLWDKMDVTDEATEMIAKARDAGITVVLFTNASEDRAREVAWNAGISYYASAKKPFPFRYRKAIAELSFRNMEVMTVGDQIFTDVLGGNIDRCTTVLTYPLSAVEFAGTRLLRFLERLIVGRKLVFPE